MDVLSALLVYFNSRGVHFHNNMSCCSYVNNYSQQQCAASVRLIGRKKLKAKRNISGSSNTVDKRQIEQAKALEHANLKKGLGTKIGEKNKGYKLMYKMNYENNEALVKNAEGVKINDKVLATVEEPIQHLPVSRISKKEQKAEPNISGSSNTADKRQIKQAKALEKANLKKGLETKIGENNKGYELMLKMNYENGKGLGKNADGITEPLLLVNKNDRKGLATVGEGTQSLSKNRRKQLRNEANLKKELKTKIGEENKGYELMVEMNYENGEALVKNAEGVKVNDKVLATVAEPTQHLSKGQRKRLIRRLRKEAELAAKVSVSEESHENIKQKAVLQATKASASNTLKKDQIEHHKVKFSVKDPCTMEFLNAMARCFSSEIKLMQLRLEATNALNANHIDHDMIIARISKYNNEIIANDIFEFIRTDLVGWIGVYQREGLDTPIFHDIENKNNHVNIICENDYAYNCLDQCIKELSKIKSIGSLNLSRQPVITPVIYCFDFIYEGLARDVHLFLTQLRLHKSKLLTDNWIVVSHDVCPQESLTYFIFVIDERSALALNYQCSRSFCVCLQTVKFRFRGIVA